MTKFSGPRNQKFLNTVASQKSKLKKNLKKTVNLVGVG